MNPLIFLERILSRPSPPTPSLKLPTMGFGRLSARGMNMSVAPSPKTSPPAT